MAAERPFTLRLDHHERRIFGGDIMKTIFAAVCLLSLALASPVQAKGCIKGAIVGGVAGHMAGHGKLGAVAGCVVGHHEANKQNGNNPNNSNAQAPSGQK
jgi:outer membrane lipoprotein SlyB